jgi:hypothetical protein
MVTNECLKKLKKWDLISVVWEDIFCRYGAQNSTHYVDSYQKCVRKTAGFYLGHKEGRLFVAETDDRHAQLDDVDCESITTFPIQNIIEIE